MIVEGMDGRTNCKNGYGKEDIRTDVADKGESRMGGHYKHVLWCMLSLNKAALCYFRNNWLIERQAPA